MNDWKDKLSLVYSTGPSTVTDDIESTENQIIETSKQNLVVGIERKNRGGKTVTWIRGFRGTTDQIDELCKKIKTKCGVGGSAKDGEIIIQGENKSKVAELLKEWGYRVKVSG